jgi:outer membrane protein assembly factor BamD (BamD/ComL family)
MRAVAASLFVASVLCIPATGSTLDTIEQLIRRTGLSNRQQQNVRNQMQRIAQQREKERQKQRQEARKKSLQYIKEAYEKAKKAYSEKRYSAAYLHYMDVASSSLKAAAKISAEAKSKVLEIEAMALSRLEMAKILLLQNQPMQAADILQEVIRDFPYCDAADQAKSRLQGLRSVPSVAGSIAYSEAKAHEDAENYGKALEIYSMVMARWPDEIAALRARMAAGKIRQDPEKMELVKESTLLEAHRVCPTLINLAKSYIMNHERLRASERPDPDAMKELRLQASEKLNQVVRDFPDTPYAEEAAKLLKSVSAK